MAKGIICLKFAVTTQIVLDILQRIILLQAVVVDRNLLTYYRLPTTYKAAQSLLNSSDISYYVMQCPFQATLTIPRPHEMPICTIVGRFTESNPYNRQKNRYSKRKLNTRVDYDLTPPARSKTKHKAKRMLKLVKIKPSQPQVAVRRPHPNNPLPKTAKHSKPKGRSEADQKRTILKPIRVTEDYDDDNADFLFDDPSLSSEEEVSETKDSTLLYHERHQKEKSGNSNVTKSNGPKNAATEMSKEESNYSPLRYLGVKDAIDVLKTQSPAQKSPFGDTEKFFADQKNYTKGVQTKAYHNIYHRDETFNDHIFYDDVEQHGNFDHHQKALDDVP